MSLTPKQEKFAQEYIRAIDAEMAQKASGYEYELAIGYYVYFLIDPRSNAIFYVGKGKGGRVSQHVKNAKSGNVDNAQKHKKIIEILDEGLDVYERVFVSFSDEKSAYQVEKQLIEMFKNLGLTNIANGVTSNDEKDKQIASELLKRLVPVWWIKKHSNPKLISALESKFGSIEKYDEFVRGVLLGVIGDE